ncbi:MAG: hypothetical protein JNG86_13795 [Verrucomicrobiaceae bacterium]|nr:hypothetical protein [Verrucomicrobiaceae bacterium]
MNTNPIFSSRSLLLFSLCYSGLLLASPTGPTPTTQQQRDLIAERHRLASEWMKSRAELRDSMKSDSEMINRGDLAPLDKAVAAKDFLRLSFIFEETEHRRFGPPEAPQENPDVGAAERTAKAEEFNRRIRDATKERITSIPGHSDYWVKQIEEACQDPRIGHVRESALKELGELGSMEAIQHLAVYLDDNRHPEAAFRDGKKALPKELWQSRPNYYTAAQALQQALGDDAPVRDKTTQRILRGDELDGYDFETLQAWWKSDAAKPYREWKFETHEPMPPPRLRAKPLMAVQPGSAGDEAKGALLKPDSASGMPVWLLITICAGGIAATTLLATRKPRR